MSNELEPAESPRRIWPWFLLAAVVLAAVLAFLWVSAEVRRIQSIERFDYRVPVKTTPTPATGTVASATVVVAAVVTNDLPGEFREALTGGDAVAGRNIFFNKPEASCAKCHRVGTQGGDNGPALDGIGSRQTREFILESMVAPNASIAKGFETVIVRLQNGSGLSGVLRQETETSLVIHTPDDGPITVRKSEITERSVGLSPMPADFPRLISKQELSDLVAFLASLTTNAPATK